MVAAAWHGVAERSPVRVAALCVYLFAFIISLHSNAACALGAPVPITESMVRNITIPDPDGGPPTKVSNGAFGSGSIETGDYEFGEIEKIAIGDLNGDGVDDAALVLWTCPGTAFKNYDLLVITGASGKPVVGYPGIGLGDRIKLSSLSIANQKIYLEMFVHDSIIGKNATPTQRVSGVFAFENNKLVDLTQKAGRANAATDKGKRGPAGRAAPDAQKTPTDEERMAAILGDWSGEFHLVNANGTPYRYTITISVGRESANPRVIKFKQDNTLQFDSPGSVHSCTKKNVSVFSYEGDAYFEAGKYYFVQKKLYDTVCSTPGTQVFRLTGSDLEIVDVNGGQIRSGYIKKIR